MDYLGIFLLVLFLFESISLKHSRLINILTHLSTNTFTTSEAQLYWNCVFNGPNLVSTCSSYHILGGYNILGAGHYCLANLQTLDPHYSLLVRFTLIKIDQWNSNIFFVSIDKVLSSSMVLSSENDLNQKLCSTTQKNDAVRIFSINVTHNAASVSIKLFTDLTTEASISSWGFRDVEIMIDACHISCSSCVGPNDNQCLSCPSTALLVSGICVCLDSYYKSSDGSCQKCDSSCQTCSGGTSSSCNSCYSYTYLQEGQCYRICPDGFWGDSATSVCQSCSSPCKTCSSTIYTCTTCQTGYYLMGSRCVDVCNPGYFGDFHDQLCKACFDQCATCSVHGYTCTSCHDGFFLSPDNSCHTSCWFGYWKNEFSLTCEKCNSPCESCSLGGSICTSCQLNYFLKGNVCQESCPVGMFEEKINRQCLPCNEKCQTCEGYASNCTSCPSGLFLEKPNCLSLCSSGNFHYSLSVVCEACNSNCLTCESSPFTCSSCVSPLVLNLDKTCKTSCSARQYLDSQNNCQNCDSQCSQCQDQSNFCIVCANQSLYADSGSCVSACSADKYLYATKRQCFICNKTCNGCMGPTSKQCLACFSDRYLYQSQCYSTCPDYTYKKTDVSGSGACFRCETNCIHCINSTFCLVCDSDYFLNEEQSCEKRTKIRAGIYPVENPFMFFINFTSPTSLNYYDLNSSIAQDIQAYFLKNETNTSIDYFSTTTVDDSQLDFYLYYLQTIISKDYRLCVQSKNSIRNPFQVTFEPNCSEIQPFFQLCSDQFYYDFNIGNCKFKRTISFSLKYTIDPLIYQLNIQGDLSQNMDIIPMLFNLSINTTDFNYSVDNIQSDSTSHYILTYKMSFAEPISGGPVLTVSVNASQTQVFVNHIIFLNTEAFIVLKDWYETSAAEQQLSSSTNGMGSFADTFNIFNLYINVILNGDSSFLIQGLMLLNIVNLLKYITINYPYNVNIMFASRSNHKNLFGLPLTQIDQQDSEVLPQIFQFYNVSEYVLNNICDVLLEIGIIVFIEFILVTLWKWTKFKRAKLKEMKESNTGSLKCYLKTLKFLKKIFIWSFLFNLLFSKYQFFVFFIFSSLKFRTMSEPKGFFNLFLSVLFSLIILLLPLHIFLLLHKTNKLLNLSARKIESAQRTQARIKITPINDCLEILPTQKVTPEKKSQGGSAAASPKYTQDECFEEFTSSNNPSTSENQILSEGSNSIRHLQSKFQNLRIRTQPVLKHIEVHPVKIARENEVRSDWGCPSPTSQKDHLSLIEEENIPDLELCNANEGVNVERKMASGGLNLKQKKSLYMFFDVNMRDFKTNLILNTEVKRTQPPEPEVPPVLKEPEKKIKKSSREQLNLYLNLMKKLFLFGKISQLFAWFYSHNNCKQKQFKRRFMFLSHDFNHKNLLQEYYLFFDFLRHFLVTSTIVVYYGSAFFQITLLCVVNCIFYLIMIIGRPYKNKYLMVLTFINETLINIALISTLELALADRENGQDHEKRQKIGWIMIFANLSLMYTLVITTLVKLCLIFPWSKMKCLKRNKVSAEPQIKTADKGDKNQTEMIQNQEKKRSQEISVFNLQ